MPIQSIHHNCPPFSWNKADYFLGNTHLRTITWGLSSGVQGSEGERYGGRQLVQNATGTQDSEQNWVLSERRKEKLGSPGICDRLVGSMECWLGRLLFHCGWTCTCLYGSTYQRRETDTRAPARKRLGNPSQKVGPQLHPIPVEQINAPQLTGNQSQTVHESLSRNNQSDKWKPSLTTIFQFPLSLPERLSLFLPGPTKAYVGQSWPASTRAAQSTSFIFMSVLFHENIKRSTILPDSFFLTVWNRSLSCR